MNRNTTSLLDLANELIAIIIEYTTETTSLLSLSLTCQRLQDLTERQLYRCICLRTARQVALLSSSLAYKPERTGYIHTIITERKDATNRNGLLSLVPVIRSAKNLRDLTVEISTGDYNLLGMRDERHWDSVNSLLWTILPYEFDRSISLLKSSLPPLKRRKFHRVSSRGFEMVANVCK
jgi:hypothetical protein